MPGLPQPSDIKSSDLARDIFNKKVIQYGEGLYAQAQVLAYNDGEDTFTPRHLANAEKIMEKEIIEKKYVRSIVLNSAGAIIIGVAGDRALSYFTNGDWSLLLICSLIVVIGFLLIAVSVKD
jgi:hypothetical protein